MVLVGSLLAVVYVWRVVEVMYRVVDNPAPVREAPLSMLAPTWLLALANIYFGIDTGFSVGMAEGAAGWLMEGVQ